MECASHFITAEHHKKWTPTFGTCQNCVRFLMTRWWWEKTQTQHVKKFLILQPIIFRLIYQRWHLPIAVPFSESPETRWAISLLIGPELAHAFGPWLLVQLKKSLGIATFLLLNCCRTVRSEVQFIHLRFKCWIRGFGCFWDQLRGQVFRRERPKKKLTNPAAKTQQRGVLDKAQRVERLDRQDLCVRQTISN